MEDLVEDFSEGDWEDLADFLKLEEFKEWFSSLPEQVSSNDIGSRIVNFVTHLSVVELVVLVLAIIVVGRVLILASKQLRGLIGEAVNWVIIAFLVFMVLRIFA